MVRLMSVAVLLSALASCGQTGERGEDRRPVEPERTPIQSIAACSVVTADQVADALETEASETGVIPMISGGVGCGYKTDGPFDTVFVFVENQAADRFAARCGDSSAEPPTVGKIGDEACTKGKASVYVLVNDRFIAVGGRLASPSHIARLERLARVVSESVRQLTNK